MDTTSSQNIQVYTSEGYPEGSEITHSLDVAPALLAIDPPIGSSAGSKIKVTGSGFGTSTAIGLKAGSADLCASVEIFEFGSFYCYTNAIEVANGTAITITVDGSANADSFIAGDASYQQTEMITITDISTSGNVITFTGTSFPTSDYTGSAQLNGVSADTVVINSATEAVAAWTTTGVPTATTAPTLTFTHTDGYALDATVDSAVVFNVTQDVTSSTASLECSFAGGCTYSIESDGLYATLLNSANQIKLCGTTCALRDDLSSASYAVCELP